MSAYAALTTAGYRAPTRDKTTLFLSFAFPLLFLVVLALLLSGQDVDQSGEPFIGYIAPGVLSWGVVNSAVLCIGLLLTQRRRDVLPRLSRRTPTRLTTVRASRHVLALAVGAAQSVLLVGVATLPAFGLEADGRVLLTLPVLVALPFGLVALGTYRWSDRR